MDTLRRFYPSMLPKGCVCFFNEPTAFMVAWAELQPPVLHRCALRLMPDPPQQTVVLKRRLRLTQDLEQLNQNAHLGVVRYFMNCVPWKFKYRHGPGVIIIMSLETSNELRRQLRVFTTLGRDRINRLIAAHRPGDALVIMNKGYSVFYYSHSRPLLHWSPETHMKFDQEFQEKVNVLLEIHRDTTSIFNLLPLNVLHDIIAAFSLLDQEFYRY